jgi:hypothetical protein
MIKSSLIMLLPLLLLSQFVGTVTAASDTIISDDKYVQGKITVIQPNNSTEYNEIMLLNFTIEWIVKAPVLWLSIKISYSLDNSPVEIVVDERNIPPDNTTTSITTVINTSVLKNGNHSLTIHVDGDYDLDNLFLRSYNYSFEPIFFAVDNSTPTPSQTPNPSSVSTSPSPTIPEFTTIAIIPFLVAVIPFVILMKQKKHQVISR